MSDDANTFVGLDLEGFCRRRGDFNSVLRGSDSGPSSGFIAVSMVIGLLVCSGDVAGVSMFAVDAGLASVRMLPPGMIMLDEVGSGLLGNRNPPNHLVNGNID